MCVEQLTIVTESPRQAGRRGRGGVGVVRACRRRGGPTQRRRVDEHQGGAARQPHAAAAGAARGLTRPARITDLLTIAAVLKLF